MNLFVKFICDSCPQENSNKHLFFFLVRKTVSYTVYIYTANREHFVSRDARGRGQASQFRNGSRVASGVFIVINRSIRGGSFQTSIGMNGSVRFRLLTEFNVAYRVIYAYILYVYVYIYNRQSTRSLDISSYHCDSIGAPTISAYCDTARRSTIKLLMKDDYCSAMFALIAR